VVLVEYTASYCIVMTETYYCQYRVQTFVKMATTNLRRIMTAYLLAWQFVSYSSLYIYIYTYIYIYNF